MKLIEFVMVCIGVAGLLLGMTACSVSGKVNIVTHSDSSVLLSEETDYSKTDDMRVHWWLDGTTLRVRCSAPGVRFSVFNHGKK